MAADIIQRIKVIIDTTLVGSGLKEGNAQLKKLVEISRLSGSSVELTRNAMARAGIAISETGSITQEGVKGFLDLDDAAKQVQKRQPRFRGDLLSTMFVFQGLSSAVMGILGPVLDLFGVTKLMSAAWIILLVPAMKMILPLFISFVQWVSGLSENWKIFIGFIIIAIAVLSPILAVIAALGILITTVGWEVVLAGAAIYAAIVVIIGVFAVFHDELMWVYDAIVFFAKAVWELVTGDLSGLVDLFSTSGYDLWIRFLDGMKSAWGTVTSWFSGAWEWIKGLLSFDNAANDAMAARWGRDMMTNFARGVQEGGNFVGLAPTINVNASVASGIDMTDMARTISSVLQTEMSRGGY